MLNGVEEQGRVWCGEVGTGVVWEVWAQVGVQGAGKKVGELFMSRELMFLVGHFNGVWSEGLAGERSEHRGLGRVGFVLEFIVLYPT